MSPSSPELPPPGQAALRHSQVLSERIREAIAAAGGWIDFARYMEMALYEPGLGYYAAGAHKLGAAGDFVTAPELSSLFSWTLARQVAEVLRATGGEILELGAGTGRMAFDLLCALAHDGAPPTRYRILEVSAELRARQRDRLSALPAELFARIEWLEALPASLDGIVLANEVLDALPVHLVVWDEHGVFERGVRLDEDAFVHADRALTSKALRTRADALRARIEPPYLSEVCLRAPALVHALAQGLARGILLFIDYGFGAAEYYHPQRNRGTLMCHYRHRAHDDPFHLPGLQDITAHVDFTSIAQAGVEAGLVLLGYTTQAHFLINLGITDLLSRTADPVDQARQTAGVHKLLSPAEMGESFKVLALGRGVEGLSGFVHGDLSRLL